MNPHTIKLIDKKDSTIMILPIRMRDDSFYEIETEIPKPPYVDQNYSGIRVMRNGVDVTNKLFKSNHTKTFVIEPTGINLFKTVLVIAHAVEQNIDAENDDVKTT